MSFFIRLLVVFSLTSVVCSYDYQHTVVVYASKNSCNVTSLHIAELPTQLQNSTNVAFCEKIIQLNETLKISDKSNIRLNGDGVTIICQEKGAIILKNIKNLVIHGFQFTQCGDYYDNHIIFTATLLVMSCADTRISGVNVVNSTGVDVYMQNAEGTTEIVESNFVKENGVKESSYNIIPNFRVYTDFNAQNAKITVANCTFGHSMKTFFKV